jgi:hypothetical protein
MFSHLLSHWGDVLAGTFGLSVLAHLVSQWPTPQNKYWQAILGTIQWAVGQRLQAAQTISGQANVNALAQAAIPPSVPIRLDVTAEPAKGASAPETK